MRRSTEWLCGIVAAGLLLALAPLSRAGAAQIDWRAAESEAIARLQAYIRVNTTNPPGNETPAAELLRGWLATEGIETRLYDATGDPTRQALVAWLRGSSGRTIVLMSHSDVVPAVAEEWSHPPFAADIVDDTMYGRGALDTKSLGILQLTTMVLLQRTHATPRDTIMLLIEPDEEEGGSGIRGMLERYPDLFRDTRLVLNEGAFALSDIVRPGQTVFFVQSAEKGAAWMKLTAHGDSGHASIPIANNAVTRMARALDRVAAYQTPLRPAPTVVRMFQALADQQPFPNSFVMRHIDNPIVQRLFAGPLTQRPVTNAMLRTTISLTGVHGGYKTNVIPAEVDATLDGRVTMGDSAEALRQEIIRIIDDPQITVELINVGTPNESPIDAGLFSAITAAVQSSDHDGLVAPTLSSGVTDSAYFRERGVPAYGFNPVTISEKELGSMHGIDERLPLAGFRTGVRIYYDLVSRVAGVPEN